MNKFQWLLIAPLALAACTVTNHKPTLHTIGDSTMAQYEWHLQDPADPARGWVQELPEFIDTARLAINNCAVSGRSSKSFIDEGKWQNVLDKLEKGDFLLIQFGHNDAKNEDPKRFTDPETSFKENLAMFVAAAREKGAVPIIATSIVRRRFDADGKVRDSHGRYAPAAAETAAQTNTTLVDMNALTGALVESYGPERSTELYLYIEPGTVRRFPDGNRDDTHLNEKGAREFARLFARECAQNNNPLAGFVIKERLND